MVRFVVTGRRTFSRIRQFCNSGFMLAMFSIVVTEGTGRGVHVLWFHDFLLFYTMSKEDCDLWLWFFLEIFPLCSVLLFSQQNKEETLIDVGPLIGTNMSRLMTKPTKWHVRPAETHISLGIRPVWSEFLLSLATHWAHSEDSDQTGRMPRLIWVFAGRTVILLVLSWGGSYVKHLQSIYRRRCHWLSLAGKTFHTEIFRHSPKSLGI